MTLQSATNEALQLEMKQLKNIPWTNKKEATKTVVRLEVKVFEATEEAANISMIAAVKHC